MEDGTALLAAKRGTHPDLNRGGSQPPHPVAAATNATAQRVLAVKLEFDWAKEADKALFQRLRDLSWQAARYRNGFVRRLWAEAMGWRVAGGTEGESPLEPAKTDEHGITKQGRQAEKGELSGAAYSAAEREAAGAWQRDCRKIMAGQPLPEWKPTAALSIRGHKLKRESGVRLEVEADQYVAYLSAQSRDSPGGCWLRLPIAKHTRRDEYQGGVLNGMVNWSIPIAKASLQIKRHEIVLRLTYAITIPLPRFGDRVATLGPLEKDGRLHLRTELQTKDYTGKMAAVLSRKDGWDKIRRRVMCQIGRKHGHARAKREKLAEITSFGEWMRDYSHSWTRQIVDWCESQGVGTIRVVQIDTGDWPAYQFVRQLRYKAEAIGMRVVEGADMEAESSERAAESIVRKQAKAVKRRTEAVRELSHQLG